MLSSNISIDSSYAVLYTSSSLAEFIIIALPLALNVF